MITSDEEKEREDRDAGAARQIASAANAKLMLSTASM